MAGAHGGRPAAAGRDQRRGHLLPPALVGTAGRPPGGLPLADRRRAGADRDHRGRPGRIAGVRRLARRRTPSPPTRAASGSAPTWPAATTPTTCWSSTRARATPPPTAPKTTSPCWIWPSRG